MKTENKLISVIFIITFFFCEKICAQTVIDYSGFSTSQCNAFYPFPPTIGGCVHTTTCGTMTVGTTNASLILESGAANNIYKGTEYKIAYNFLQGTSYSIKINARCSTPTFPEPNSKLRVDLNSASNGGGTACMGAELINTTSALTASNNQSITPGTFFDYTFSIPALSGAQNYIYIGSFLPYVNGTATSWLEIKKVTITVNTPAASFTLPVSTQIQCGSSASQTFTVTNVNSTPGVTNYTWNLGANNGWLYNGSAAPSTISTVSNSIILTPVCSAVPGNISATVTAGGVNYNTNANIITITQPNLAINGNKDIICSAETYSIDNLPCNASVVWSTSGTGSVTPASYTGSTVTLNKVSSGYITLTAAVTSCGVTTTLTLPGIRVGGFSGSDITITSSNGTSFFCFNTTLSFGATGLPGLENRTWNTPSNWPVVTGGANSIYVVVTPVSQSGPPMATISFNATSCGVPITASKVVTYSSSVCTGAALYSVSPNPISNYGYIYIQSNYPQTQKICAVQVTDLSGNILLNQVYGCVATTQYVSNNNGLPSGQKFVRVYDGSQWYSYPLTVL